MWKGKLVVDRDPDLKKQLIQHFHSSAIGGHSRMHVTYHKLVAVLY